MRTARKPGLAPVVGDMALMRAARDHAEDMIVAGFFSHTGTGGSSVGDRAHRQGYGWCFIAENIAQGHPGLAEVIESWMQSPGPSRQYPCGSGDPDGRLSWGQ